jgi:hypothetical protein
MPAITKKSIPIRRKTTSVRVVKTPVRKKSIPMRKKTTYIRSKY